jgi:hypothetical protein
MLGEEEIPTSPQRNNIMKRETYMDKVLSHNILHINTDKL